MSDQENNGPSTHYHALLACAPMIGEDCVDVNTSYAECRIKDANPKLCQQEGEKVTGCTLRV